MPYPIFINREIRRKTEYILIVHAPDFVAVNHPVEGDLAKDYIDVQDQRQSDIMKANQDKLNAKQQYDLSITGLY